MPVVLARPWAGKDGVFFLAHRYQREKTFLSTLQVSYCLCITDVSSCEMCVLCLVMFVKCFGFDFKNLSGNVIVAMSLFTLMLKHV